MKKADIRVFLGKSGSGKSTLARFQTGGARVLIFDPNAEDENAAGAWVIDQAAELLTAVASSKTFRICWRGLATMGAASFEYANEIAWKAENLTVLWEEIDRFSSAGFLPDYAYRIVNMGRHRDIRVRACARRPAAVARDLTANAGRILAFKTTEPRDLRYLADYMGDAAAGFLPGLAPYTAVDWSDAGAPVKKSPFS